MYNEDIVIAASIVETTYGSGFFGEGTTREPNGKIVLEGNVNFARNHKRLEKLAASVHIEFCSDAYFDLFRDYKEPLNIGLFRYPELPQTEDTVVVQVKLPIESFESVARLEGKKFWFEPMLIRDGNSQLVVQKSPYLGGELQNFVRNCYFYTRSMPRLD